ncbi:MAG: hypothetical protein BWX98_02177 [Candidatus Aminicenantes bacterium ADurb.Bin147]|nr:MAG: hypothetical protein BWX98_02177 [Candidatus Aminicenantes bacterium ADurb.Bin147]
MLGFQVAPDADRLAALHVARSDLKPQGHAPHLIFGKLPAGSGFLPGIEVNPEAGLGQGFGRGLGGRQDGFLPVAGGDGDDDDLNGRDPGREPQAGIVAVAHDQGADRPRRHPPGCLPDILEGLIAVLELDVEGLGEMLSEIMGRGHLESLAIGHEGLDGVGHLGSGELLPEGLVAGQDRDGQLGFANIPVQVQDLEGFFLGFLGRGVTGVAFLPEKLGRPEERPGHFFPADDVGPLVVKDGQIPPRFNPLRIHRADDGLGRRPDGQPLLQLFLAADRDPGDFRSESFDVLGFLLEEALRDEQREIGVDVTGGFDPEIQGFLDVFPNGVAVGSDDHHPFHRGIIGQLGFLDDFGVPAGKILALRGDLLDKSFVGIHGRLQGKMPGHSSPPPASCQMASMRPGGR